MPCNIKQEFKLHNFLFNYDYPRHFYTSPVQKSRHFFLVWRIFWFLFHLGVTFAIFLCSRAPNLGKLLLFATIWGYLFLLVTTFLDLVLVILFQYVWASSVEEKQQRQMQWYFKLSWFISNATYNASLLITIVYWVFLYHETGYTHLSINILEHAINSVYTILNLFFINKPVRLLHFWHLLTFMIVYIFVLGIYYLAGGVSIKGTRYIYPFFDFEKPKKMAIFSFGLLIACIALHFVIFLLYRVRLWLFEKFKQPQSQSADDLTSSKRDLEAIK